MTNTNSFASLGPMLLARKGAAKPAMRPQLGPIATAEYPANAGDDLASAQDLLGWNDMGEDEDYPAPETNIAVLSPFSPHDDATDEGLSEEDETDLPPLDWQPEDEDEDEDHAFAMPGEDTSPVHVQQADLAARISASAADVAPATVRRVAKQAASKGRRAAFTLRLDAERHLKLRLASTIAGESAQKLVTQALDRLLGEMPEIDQLAAQVKRG